MTSSLPFAKAAKTPSIDSTLTGVSFAGGARSSLGDWGAGHRSFMIRPADSDGKRQAANMLVSKMYSRRGYETDFLQSSKDSRRITLVASEDERTLGTLCLGLDSDNGLLVDELYGAEVDAVRRDGRSVCELTKLAIDEHMGSKHVLGSLFHIAYIYGRLMNRVTDVFIEVNPRHAPFYKRMLGFQQCGDTRICPRVNAPAVLLRLELDYVDARIRELGGTADTAQGERSLYPYFYSKREEAGIMRRLTGAADAAGPAMAGTATAGPLVVGTGDAVARLARNLSRPLYAHA